jgi:hypothetical protein
MLLLSRLPQEEPQESIAQASTESISTSLQNISQKLRCLVALSPTRHLFDILFDIAP